jgi:F-type H+-transporting ATPase subunit b
MFSTPDFWVAVAFFLFIGLLVRYKVPGLLAKTLDDRAEEIRKELDEARRLREEAQQLLVDYQRKAREAEDEAQSIIDEAKRTAEAMAADTRAALGESLERRTRLAEEKIARAETQALNEVRAAAVDTSIAVAERLLKAKLTGDPANRLVEDGINSLGSRLN